MRIFVIGLIVATFILVATSLGQASTQEALSLVMCDVGQGDAFLLTLGATQVLIDGGPVESKVLSCLARHMPRWDNTIELVIATHGDSDHIVGLVGVLQKYRVKTLLISHSSKRSAVFDRFRTVVQRCVSKGMHLVTPERGQVFVIGPEFNATVLHPNNAQPLLQRGGSTESRSASESSRLTGNESFQADCAGIKPDHSHTKLGLARGNRLSNWQLEHIYRDWSENMAQIWNSGVFPPVALASGQTAVGSGHGLSAPRYVYLENTEQKLQDVSGSKIALSGASNTDENDGSIVVLIVFRNTTYLFTGDIGGEVELSLLTNPLTLGVDVLKTSHHGSKTGTVEGFLRAIRPEWALISAGKDNSYGHPHLEVLSRLEQVGSHVLRTDHDGEIELISDGESIWLHGQRKLGD